MNGGKIKKISNFIDFEWLYYNFGILISKYFEATIPLRKIQEKLSEELQHFGFPGTIHGCIVDIDFYHHIMINTYDGSFTYYYSPEFGYVQNFKSFKQVLQSIENQKDKHDNHNYLKIASEVSNNSILNQISSKSLTSSQKCDESLREIGRSSGMYGISRNVAPLQKLYTAHVLQRFDAELCETLPNDLKSLK